MHYQDGKDHLDYKKIVQETNTQIFFMGSHKIKTLAQKCIDNGMSEDTPIAIGSHLTYPEQKVYTSTLKEILNTDLHQSITDRIGKCRKRTITAG